MRFCIFLPVLALALGAGPSTRPTTAPTDSSSVNSPAAAASPRNRPVGGASADGTPFPEVTAKYWWEETKLPQIGQLIGSMPGGVGNGVVYLSATNSTAQRAREQIGKYGIDARGYDWVTKNVAGCGFALLRVTGGRISGVCLIGNNTAESWNRKGAAIANGGIREGRGFRVGQLNYKMRTAGSWVEETAEARDMRGNVIRAGSKKTHPAAMYIEMESFDWTMATLCSTKAAYTACLLGRVEIGMRAVEAYRAMRDYRLKRLKNPDGSELWAWTRDEAFAKSERVYNDNWGTTVVSEREIQRVSVARATIVNGTVATFEWTTAE